MKREIRGIVVGVIATCLVLGTVFTAFGSVGNQTITAAYNNIKIYVNKQIINPADANGNPVEPFVSDGTTYLPVRAIADALGKNVSWDNATKSVYIDDATAYSLDPAAQEPTFSAEAITLGSGNYTAGTDFPAGTYTIRAMKGSGNVYSSNAYSGGISAILATQSEIDARLEISESLGNMYSTEYKNVALPSGTSLRVDGVTVDLIRTK